MRFCMVTTFYPPYNFGGDGIYVQFLARALFELGHEVEVVHCEDAYRLGAKSSSATSNDSSFHDGIIVHRLRSRTKFVSPFITQQTGFPGLKHRKLQSIFEKNFDVVNFHNISLIGGPGILAMSPGRINLLTLHEHWLICPTHILWKNKKKACERPTCFSCSIRSGIPPQFWRYTNLLQKSLLQVDCLVSPSDYTAKRHREAGITRPIHVLPSSSRFSPPPPSDYNGPDHPSFLYVGRITASKGVIELLKTFESLDNYDLNLVGSGDLFNELKFRYRDFQNIKFLGKASQCKLAVYYQKATCLIVPSLAPEVLGLVILEAFAHGVPAIVRDAGGCREPIDRTGAGFVYNSTTEFREALHNIATDKRLRESLGRLARKGYEKYYSRKRFISSYLNLVQNLQDNCRPDVLTNS